MKVSKDFLATISIRFPDQRVTFKVTLPLINII